MSQQNTTLLIQLAVIMAGAALGAYLGELEDEMDWGVVAGAAVGIAIAWLVRLPPSTPTDA